MDFVINVDEIEIERRALMNVDDHAAEEAAAWKMLYSDLDDGQQAMYEMLVEQGIIPPVS